MFNDVKKPIFVMSPPFKFNADIPNNYWMSKLPKEQRKIDLTKAIDQWHHLYDELSKNSIIYLLPTSGINGNGKPLQDQIFTANTGVVLMNNWDRIIVANFKSEPRRGETHPAVEFFKNVGYRDIVVPEKVYFEGEADLKPIFGTKNVYIGAYGMRTSLSGLKWFQETQNIKIIPLKTNPKAYHLDCIVFPVDKEKIVIIEDMVSPNVLHEIEKYAELIPIKNEEVADTGITNCIRAGKNVICGIAIDGMSSKHEQYKNEKRKIEIWEKLASKLGLNFIPIVLSEFRKGGGDASCLCMRLNPGLEFKDR